MKLCFSKRKMLAHALDRTGGNRLLTRFAVWRGVLVLNYHRIGQPGESLFDKALWSATEEEFDRQVAYLVKHFDVIRADDLDTALESGNGRYAMITFDDGYRDNFECAFPILQDHAATATFFLSTGFLDKPRVAWWDEIAWMVRASRLDAMPAGDVWGPRIEFDEPDRDSVIARLLTMHKRLDGHRTNAFRDSIAEATGSGRISNSEAKGVWMTWDMVRAMRDASMCFGGHTVNHPILSRLDPVEQDHEIEMCLNRIESELGERVIVFSYPDGQPGSFDEVSRACVQSHGIRFAFAHSGGFSVFDQNDPYAISRMPIERDTSFAEFRAIAALPQVFAY